MKYVVLGVIAPNGSNDAVAGQDTYLTSTASDWFAWDGEHADHASRFTTAELALAAAHTCRGPIFRMPDPASIHVIPSDE
jgi:2-keto-3-deoxy-L-rhamnonate aldolase RhmA